MAKITATPVRVRENNKTVTITPTPVELIVVGNHLEFPTEKGVVVGGF